MSSRLSRTAQVLLLVVLAALAAPMTPFTTGALAQTALSSPAPQYVFDFAGDAVGVRPSYVSMPWKQTGVTVVDSAWALDGRALQIAPYGTTNAFMAAVLDPVPAARDVEVFTRLRDLGPGSSSHWMTGAGARISGSASTPTAVLSQTRTGTQGLVLARLNAGSFGSLNNGFTSFAVPQAQYLRSRWSDGTVSVKAWTGTAQDEPATWTVLDHALSAPTTDTGKVGITRYFSQHTTEIDFIHVTVLDTTTPTTSPSPTTSPTPTTSPAEPLRIMPVGDSITAGSTNAQGPQSTYRRFLYQGLVGDGVDVDFVGPYDTHPKTGTPYVGQGEWDHDSLAVPGWTTSNVRSAIGSAVADHRPDVLLVFIGINDLRVGGAPSTTASRVSDALAAARASKPDIAVVLAEITPAGSPWMSSTAPVEDYNARLRQLAATISTSTSQVVTVDMYTGYDMRTLHYDNLHPNEVGDELIGDRFGAKLAEAFGIGRRSLA